MNLKKLWPWLAIGAGLYLWNKNKVQAPTGTQPGPTGNVQDSLGGFQVSWR